MRACAIHERIPIEKHRAGKNQLRRRGTARSRAIVVLRAKKQFVTGKLQLFIQNGLSCYEPFVHPSTSGQWHALVGPWFRALEGGSSLMSAVTCRFLRLC